MDTHVVTIMQHFNAQMDQIDWYSGWYQKHAWKLKTLYMSLRIPALVLGTMIPTMIVIQSVSGKNTVITVFTVVASMLVAILTTLDSFFRWGETYVEDKTAELALYSILRKYAAERVKFEADPQKQGVEEAKALLDALRAEFEAVVSGTTRAFAQRARMAAEDRKQLISSASEKAISKMVDETVQKK